MLWPAYCPAPKSGCSGVDAPMKLIIEAECGSTGALAMFLFQRLSAGKGINPLRPAPAPVAILLHPSCAGSAGHRHRSTSKLKTRFRMKSLRRNFVFGDKAHDSILVGPRAPLGCA